MNLFLLQLSGELRKLFARKRTYIGFAAFFCMELLVLGLLQLPRVQGAFRRVIEGSGYGFEEYFSGLTLAFQILSYTIFFLGALYLSLVAGDVVSKEVEDGTMRMILCRPVSRVRLLLVKYLACVIYTFALIAFIAITALVAGLLRQGIGGFFVFAPLEKLFALYSFGPGLVRYLCAIPLLSLSLLSVTSLAFLLSCCNMKPAAATIVTLSIFFVDMIFRAIPWFESIRHWFVTAHMSTWLNVFQPNLPVLQMVQDYAYLLALDATFVIAGLAIFHGRDFKS